MPDSLCAVLVLAAASLLALVLGGVLAAWLAMARFAGRLVVLAVLGALAAVPPGVALLLMPDRPMALAAWAVLAAPLALLLVYMPLASGWARHGRGLQSAGVSRWQALRPLLASQWRALLAAWLAVLARGLGEAAAGLALGLVAMPVSPLLLLGVAVVAAGVAVWVRGRVPF